MWCCSSERVELVARRAGRLACLFVIECVGRSVGRSVGEGVGRSDGRSVDVVELCADSGESSVDESDLEAVGDAAHASVELTTNVVLRARVAGGGVGDGEEGSRGGEDGGGFVERGRGHVAGAGGGGRSCSNGMARKSGCGTRI